MQRENEATINSVRWALMVLAASAMVSLSGCAYMGGTASSAPQGPYFNYVYYSSLHPDQYGNWHPWPYFTERAGLPLNMPIRAVCGGGTGQWEASSVTLATGRLPPGLNLDSNGDIVGVPTTAGDYSSTIQVTGINYSGLQFPDQTVYMRIIVTGD